MQLIQRLLASWFTSLRYDDVRAGGWYAREASTRWRILVLEVCLLALFAPVIP